MIEIVLFSLCIWISFRYSHLMAVHGIFILTYLLVSLYYISLFTPIGMGLIGSINAISFILPMLGIPVVFAFSIIGVLAARKINSNILLLCHSFALSLSVIFVVFVFVS